jgi:8-oxo-dGTP pyrophosphatase MutT (NUDIX family)
MSFELISQNLKTRLSSALPGREVQYVMASYHRYANVTDIPENAKLAATTLILFPKNQKWYFCLIQRPAYDGPHGGQIAMPGGKMEAQDINLINTAIRETFEEIGVLLNHTDVIGELTSLYIPVSNMHVYPFIAIITQEPEFNKQDTEVDEILVCELEELIQQDNSKITSVKINEQISIKTPYFLIKEKLVWGATAMMLNEFKMIWQEANS